MYKFIINPTNNKHINVNSKTGKDIVKSYLKTYLSGGGKNYFRKGNTLNNKQKKFCRCVLHVAKNNSNKCNTNKLWKSHKCYNPYTVCASSVKTTTGGKSCQYNLLSKDIPDKEIIAYSQLNKKKYNQWALKNDKSDLSYKNIDELRLKLDEWYSK